MKSHPKFACILLLGLLSFAPPGAGQGPKPELPGESKTDTCTDLSGKVPLPCPSSDGTAPGSPAAPPDVEEPAGAPASQAPRASSAAFPTSASTRKKLDASGSHAAAPTVASAAAAPPNSASPSDETPPISLKVLPRNLVLDQKRFWTSPARLRLNDLKFVLPFAVATSGLIAADDRIEAHLPDNPNTIRRANDVGKYGAAGFAGVVGGAYLLGWASHNDHLRETGLLSGEAAANSVLATYAIKFATGRSRPSEGDHKGEFGNGGLSFPSQHAAAAWSIASVIAQEYPGPLTKLLAYGGAAGISASRIIGRDHFASDVFIGSALGWFIGHQVYRAHFEPDAGRYGTFERAPREAGGLDPSHMGSPYVPLDSWTYAVFDRLAARGYLPTAFLGLRPWTRMECARLLQEAKSGINLHSSADQELFEKLELEFAPELRSVDTGRNRGARVESVYSRVTGISGPPLTDSYHFGQTIVNDYGRPYQQGANLVAGLSASAVAGPLAVYVRGEYQHAPSAGALPPAARQAIAAADFLPEPPPLAQAEINRLKLLEAYATLNLSGWQFSLGRQALWWGPDAGGPMLFSNNAPPFDLVRLSHASPLRLPGPLRLMGPIQTEFFFGRLQGYHFMRVPGGLVGSFDQTLDRQPFIHGQKLSFKPTPNLEIGFSRTTIFGGAVFPLTWGRFSDSLFATFNTPAATENKPGDRRSALDFTYRIPKLRDWVTFYADGFTDDEFSPVAYWDRSAWTAGLYLPRLPMLPKVDLRMEGVYTDLPAGGALAHGFFYFNDTWRGGYTNQGNLIGSWIGRQGQGARVWSTYHFSPRNYVQLGFRHQKTSWQFIPGGGTLTDASVKSEFQVRSDVTLSALVQYEKWNFPVLSALPHAPLVTSIQLTYWPRWEVK